MNYKSTHSRLLLPMKRNGKVKTEIKVSYKYNGIEEPERLNRVYDMIFAKVIKKLLSDNHENTQTRG